VFGGISGLPASTAIISAGVAVLGTPAFGGISGLPVASAIVSAGVSTEGTPAFHGISGLPSATAITSAGVSLGTPVFISHGVSLRILIFDCQYASTILDGQYSPPILVLEGN
jgi:hypothetical protein